MFEIKIQSVEGWLCCGEASDPIYKLDFEAKEKVQLKLKSDVAWWNQALGTRLYTWLLQFALLKDLPSIFSFENEKKTFVSPEKGSTRVAGDAAIVNPPFWDRLQKTDFQYLSVSTNMYGLLPICTHDSNLSLNTWWQTAHSARLVVWFKLEGWRSIIVLDKLPSRTFLEYLCNDSTVIWMLS